MRSAKNPRPPYFGCTISAGAACESRNFPFSDIEKYYIFNPADKRTLLTSFPKGKTSWKCNGGEEV
jgi:hypothetical protein